MYQDFICNELNEVVEMLVNFLQDEVNIYVIQCVVVLLVDSFKVGGKVLFCGNGGFYCDVMYFVEELIGCYCENCLGYLVIVIFDVSYFFCVSNDFGYEYVFFCYVEFVGCVGDVLFGIFMFGNFGNVIKVIEVVWVQGMKVIILIGKDGGKMVGSVDVEICVLYFGYVDCIQEIYIKVIYILIMLIEKEMVKG